MTTPCQEESQIISLGNTNLQYCMGLEIGKLGGEFHNIENAVNTYTRGTQVYGNVGSLFVGRS